MTTRQLVSIALICSGFSNLFILFMLMIIWNAVTQSWHILGDLLRTLSMDARTKEILDRLEGEKEK